jgi:hypothetical protein
MTQLFDQMRWPDSVAATPEDVDQQLTRILTTPLPRPRWRPAPPPSEPRWPRLRRHAGTALLIVVGAGLGVAVARL